LIAEAVDWCGNGAAMSLHENGNNEMEMDQAKNTWILNIVEAGTEAMDETWKISRNRNAKVAGDNAAPTSIPNAIMQEYVQTRLHECSDH